MKPDARAFEPLRVSLIGVEYGRERFTKDGVTNLPPISGWRNNLTALSQHYNLYFVGCQDSVMVYEPEFPFQTLRRSPVIFIRPTLKEPNARGYLSSHREGISDHCINHLMVGDLGTQEILLIATDSGNVTAYYTSAILEAIKKEPYHFSKQALSDMVGLRPFFSQHVVQSAWGLTIHKHARMIAVSANTPNSMQPPRGEDLSASINVFAFALTPEIVSQETATSSSFIDTDASLSYPDWQQWIPERDSGALNRDRNFRIVLGGWNGHDHNIPNISFVNTSEDEQGTWLLSTDINGSMKLWQIWQGTVFKTWEFRDTTNIRPLFQDTFPGWNVAALDLKAFRLATTNDEFVGAKRKHQYFGYNERGESFNISQNVWRHLPENNVFHPSGRDPQGERETEPSAQDEIFTYTSDEDNDEIEADEASAKDTASMSEDGNHSNGTSISNQSPGQPIPGAYPQHADELETGSEQVIYELEADNSNSDFVSEEEGSIGSLPSRGSPSARKTSRSSTSWKANNLVVPEVALIHCGDSHVRLLNGPRARYPHIFCAHVLKQRFTNEVLRTPAGFEFSRMDRLNMMKTVPELGLVLIATQTGRVAVCSLTRRPDGLLGMRFDWILPTTGQEQRGIRPNLYSLLGMAVAPVQGRIDPEYFSDPEEEPDRWGKDGVFDGVKTTFEHEVPLVDKVTHVAEDEPRVNHRRKQRSVTENASPVGRPGAKHGSWSTPDQHASWKAMENTRRFRLMLTYTDMSVLTYELWRDVERHDVARFLK